MLRRINRRAKLGLLVALACIVVAALLALLPNRPAVSAGHEPGCYSVTHQFGSDRLNSMMLVSSTYEPNPNDSPAQVVGNIHRLFRPNRDPDAVAHGNAARVPVGWAFVLLRNATNQSQALVLSMPQYRCTRAVLYVGRGDGFGSVGTVRRSTPLGERFFPFLDLAFPVQLPPRATLPLLLRTESRVGFHEVDVRLSQQDTYLQTAFVDSIRNGTQVITCLMLALVAFMTGWRADARLLLTFGLYLFSVGLAFSCQFGYLNFLPYPAWLSVNSDTLGTLFRLLIGITIHPFVYEVVKPAIRNRRRYKQRVVFLCAVSAGFIGLHLLPYRYYGHVNYVTNLAMTGLDIINMVWIILYSVLAYRRAGIWSLLVVCLLIFVPVALNLLLSLFHGASAMDAFRTPVAHPMLIILALSYLTFEQFRKQLVTRQWLQTQVLATRDQINTLRRREIEGIGRDLHDQVGNTLATVLGYLDRLPADTQKPRRLIIDAINDLRFMSHNLVKDDDRPLTDKVESLVSRFNDFAPMHLSYADYTHRQIDRLSMHKQQNIYSIIQELLTNLIRHSQATQAHVQFFCDETTIDVSVEDDGIGFDWSAVGTTSGIGIQNIYKRAALSNIDVRFDPAPSGTTIVLKTSLDDTNANYSH